MTDLEKERAAYLERKAAKKIIDFAHIKPEEPSLMAKMRQRKVCDDCGARLRWLHGGWAPCALCSALASGDVTRALP